MLFSTIKPAEGFWVYNDQEEVKEYNGTNYGAEKILLHKGWNLVGIGKDIEKEELQAKGAEYIWQYENGEWRLWMKEENPKFSTKYSKIDKLHAGEGFWVYCK